VTTEFLIITGLSGAGRSQASDTFEDLGWFVIDNLPPALIGKVAELVQAPGSTTERVALAVGSGSFLDELGPALDLLRQTGARVRILFLEASNEVLIRRYENTRRRHPLAEGERVWEGIERERQQLEPVKSRTSSATGCSTCSRATLGPACRRTSSRSVTSTVCPSTSISSSIRGSCPIPTGSIVCAR
jgi:UPF0042 nucleotide-binding protein